MKDVLKNIFEDRGTRTRYLKISKRLSATRYELTDDADRIHYAESTDFYPPGTNVIVQNDIIIRPRGRSDKPKVYER